MKLLTEKLFKNITDIARKVADGETNINIESTTKNGTEEIMQLLMKIAEKMV